MRARPPETFFALTPIIHPYTAIQQLQSILILIRGPIFSFSSCVSHLNHCNSAFVHYTMSAFTRTFWRSGRVLLRSQNAVNPVQRAWGVDGSQKYVGAVRNYAAAFKREKPHVNIGKDKQRLDEDIAAANGATRNHRSRRSRKGTQAQLSSITVWGRKLTYDRRL